MGLLLAKSKYKEDFPQRAETYLKRGHIEKELAVHLGISEETLNVYKKKYPEFSESLKRGKVSTDDEVENALLKRAVGFTMKVNDKDVYYPPDVTAQIFWLKNRRPDQWRDTKNIEFKGDQKITVSITDD